MKTRITPVATIALTLALFVLGATGCTAPRPQKGGHAVTTPARTGPAGIEQSLTQGENAAQPSRQEHETITTRTYTVPAGTYFSSAPLSPTSSPTSSPPPSPTSSPTLSTTSPLTSDLRPLASGLWSPSLPVSVTERSEVRAKTELGAAQKDTAREIGAKLASLRGIIWVGVVLFVFGLASLVWPPLKAIIGSITTSAALMAGGLALIILPSLIVGNELLILGAVAVVVGAWFLAHRHGRLHGMLNATTTAPVSQQPPIVTQITTSPPPQN